MEIKRINPSESELVVELFDKYRIFYKQTPDISLARTFIRARLGNNESVIFVALVRDNNKTVPAGFTQLYPRYSSVSAVKNWILNDLYVDVPYRKQGIGERLIQTAMDFARKEKAVFMELSTATDNYTAQSLYEAIGFRKQMPEDGFYTYKIEL
ncbi:MAG: GNAT family N-acetyltransferase [Bacteroidota bacterium]|nr:GNAT family N-acetyltransferase [Bacteroidota bacterium]